LTRQTAESALRQPSEADSSVLSFLAGSRACLPVVFGYFTIGLTFGVIARASGLSPAEVTVMSLILYAGSSQFVVAGLLGAGAMTSAIVVTVFLVNVRHFLYGAALAPRLRHLPIWQSGLIGAELTDETFAVAATHLPAGRPAQASWLLGLNATAQVTWVVATTLGALVGSAVPDPRALGLDFALAAMFAALLVLQTARRPRLRRALVVVVTGGLVSLGGALVVPSSWAIVLGSVLAATVGALLEAAV
jgi:4-azaleucine resistance transporter AzlC